MLDSSAFANFLLNAHDYRPEDAKCHSPGGHEVKPRVDVVLPTIRTLKVCNKSARDKIECDSLFGGRVSVTPGT